MGADVVALEHVRKARERFLDSADEPARVRPEIAASWRRSHLSKVGVDTLHIPFVPVAHVETRLLGAAEPILSRYAEGLGDTDVSIVLADRSSRIVGRWTGDAALRRKLSAVSIDLGFVLAEEVAGTNGIGTALEEMRPVRVVGPEHYAESLHSLLCVGVPIRHPLSRHVEGILDLACPVRRANSLLIPAALDLAAQIERELSERTSEQERAVLEAFLVANRSSAKPIIAVSDRFMMTNAAAAGLLDAADQAVLWEQASAAASGRTEVLDVLALARVTVRARFRPILSGARVVGAMIEVESDAVPWRAPGRKPGPAASLAAAGLPGRSPAWSTVACRCAQVVKSLPLWLEGEHGAGKLALARYLHGAVVGSGELTVVPGGLEVVDGTESWLRTVRRRLEEPGGTLVLAHLEKVGAKASAVLCDLLGLATAGPWIVATVVPGADILRPLADRLRTQVITVPSLREREGDLPLIADALLRRWPGPAGPPRLAPDAVRALDRYPWPGNIRQLESVLQQAVAASRNGVVTAGALPEELRTGGSRRLSRIERLEFEAVQQALEDAGGNKVTAETLLGVSRSTLYRKIRCYGLERALQVIEPGRG